jgi:membrane-associated phospholipid phosphatase
VRFRFTRIDGIGQRPVTPALTVILLLLLAPAAPAQEYRTDVALWAATATAMTGAFVLDQRLRPVLGSDDHGSSLPARLGNKLGRPQVAAPVMAGVAVIGVATGDQALVRSVLNTGAGLVAAGAVNGSLKFGLGRRRPNPENDAFLFKPMNPDDQWQSFPSGHATVAFSLATAISMEARTPWVTAVSFGSAGLVGWSRLYSQRHWTSDVMGGALVGVLTTRVVVERLQELGAPASRLTPVPGGIVLTLTVP